MYLSRTPVPPSQKLRNPDPHPRAFSVEARRCKHVHHTSAQTIDGAITHRQHRLDLSAQRLVHFDHSPTCNPSIEPNVDHLHNSRDSAKVRGQFSGCGNEQSVAVHNEFSFSWAHKTVLPYPCRAALPHPPWSAQALCSRPRSRSRSLVWLKTAERRSKI